ncbi:MAG: Cna B-type domain-containing protein [Clostridiales bacterium]|nr:Cna B-type domain-containing protein [Clostridiales bacterium]
MQIRKLAVIAMTAFLMSMTNSPVYAADEVYIMFDANGGNGYMDDITTDVGSSMTLPTNAFAYNGKLFVNWNTSKSGAGASYADESIVTFTESGDVTLYAQWARADGYYTVYYDGNGADEGSVSSTTFTYGDGGTLAEGGFARAGFQLLAWNTEPDGSGTSYALGEEITEIMIGAESGIVNLYAQWIDESVRLDSITVYAMWDDSNNEDDLRPDTWVVKLYGSNGKTYEQASDSTSCIFTNMPDIDSDGNDISYMITTTNPTSYSSSITPTSVLSGETSTITYTHGTETKTIRVYGTFDDDDDEDDVRPDDVTLKLKGSNGKSYSETVDIDGDDDYEYKFVSLPTYSDGDEVTYRLSVSGASSYDTDIDKEGDTFYVTHTYESESLDIDVTTAWDDNSDAAGQRPDEFQVVLSGGGKTRSAYLNSSNNYSVTFEDMPQYKNGSKISYTLKAADTDYYNASVSGSASYGYTVTQKYTGNTSSTKTSTSNKVKTSEAEIEALEETKEAITVAGAKENEKSEKETSVFIRVVWQDDGAVENRSDTTAVITGSEGSTYQITIPKAEEKKWHSQKVAADEEYVLTVNPISGYQSEVSVTKGTVKYFTITNTDPKTVIKNNYATEDNLLDQDDMPVPAKSSGSISVGSSQNDDDDETESETAPTVTVKKKDVSNSKLVEKDSEKATKIIIGLTAFASAIFIGALVYGKVRIKS